MVARRRIASHGFKQASALLKRSVQDVSSRRGFAQSRILTHWEDIVGQDIARIATPVKVSYTKGGLGATIVLLCSGVNAPLLEMQKPVIHERVNAVYGYNAISRVRITQTSAHGVDNTDELREKQKATSPQATVALEEKSKKMVESVENPRLSAALEKLAQNVLSRQKSE